MPWLDFRRGTCVPREGEVRVQYSVGSIRVPTRDDTGVRVARILALSRAASRRAPVRIPPHRASERGVAAILAMMFVVIFGSLAAAMAIVSQGNFTTADTHLRVNRSLAAAETGMRFVTYRLSKIALNVKTRDGIIDSSNSAELWAQTRDALLADLAGETHNLAEPYVDGAGVLRIGPIAVGPGDPRFTATLQQHPISGENYASSYYQRAPFNAMSPVVSASNPLDGRWIRVRVQAVDGPGDRAITRAIQLDFKMEKRVPFAILSKNRIMIGRNVMVEGPIGSKFNEVNLTHGHPVHIVSDFAGLHSDLDNMLELFSQTLRDLDADGDNRLNINSPSETEGLTNAEQYDRNGDGFIDDYDFFLQQYDANQDGAVNATELNTDNDINADQLLTMIDSMGDPTRQGYGDGVIDDYDRYAKVRGQIALTASYESWLEGAADGNIQNYYRGPIHPKHNQPPLTFSATAADVYEFSPSDFDVATFRNAATGSLASQASQQATAHNPDDPNSPQPLGQTQFEAVPYGAAHPYDYYSRPVYENMTFTDVTIPQGTNALFRNCTFIGVTFLQTATQNTDANFNYAGMTEADGRAKFPDLVANVGDVGVPDTKLVSNNVRFDSCTFEGAVVSDAPPAYTHVRNKIAFTGRTRFNIDNSTHLSADEKALYKRSTILTPHYSV